MIDIDQFMDDIYNPLYDRCGVQIVKANQKIPPGKLESNRIVYNMILFANTDSRHTTIQDRKVVESDDPDFEYDIEESNIFFPEATISLTGFGPGIMTPINKAREWFYINNLGDWWFKDNGWDCVIREVMEIENRTTYLESDYEKRFGFDVRLEFKDVVTVRQDTIETVQIIGPGGREQSIDL